MNFIKAIGIGIILLGALFIVMGIRDHRSILWLLNVISLPPLGYMIFIYGNVKKWLE